MDLDEWGKDDFDEWEVEAYDQFPAQTQTEEPFVLHNQPQIGHNYVQPQINNTSCSGSFPNTMSPINNLASGPFPEVEIGSSSDEDAPPIPESTKLARENLELRNRVNQLVQQSKNAENNNVSLKKQLTKCRNIFKHQLKSMKKVFS